jgi:hypothetical protein
MKRGHIIDDQIINSSLAILQADVKNIKIKIMDSNCFGNKDKELTRSEIEARLYRFEPEFTTKYEKMLFPININNVHWVLIVIDIIKKQIRYRDSLEDFSKSYMCSVLNQVFSSADEKPWEVVMILGGQINTSNDCGIFVVKLAEEELNNDYDQNDKNRSVKNIDMFNYRVKMFDKIRQYIQRSNTKDDCSEVIQLAASLPVELELSTDKAAIKLVSGSSNQIAVVDNSSDTKTKRCLTMLNQLIVLQEEDENKISDNFPASMGKLLDKSKPVPRNHNTRSTKGII